MGNIIHDILRHLQYVQEWLGVCYLVFAVGQAGNLGVDIFHQVRNISLRLGNERQFYLDTR